MHPSNRVFGRQYLIVALLAVASIAIVGYAVRTGVFADPPPPCPDVECNSVCWSDGTHYNEGTKVIHKSFTDLNCGNNDGTCITQPCGHH